MFFLLKFVSNKNVIPLMLQNMKTIKQTILGIALSVFSIAAMAQCPTVTNMNVTLGANGTATVTPVLSWSVSPTQTMYYWSVTPNATQTSGTFQSSGTFQFPANGSYTLSVSINDSLSGCSSTGNTTLSISNMTTNSCNAAFTAYTDSSCVTHFVNSSVGTNLTYEWYNMSNGFLLLSNGVTPTATLGNGTHLIGLYSYSNGAFCDSVTQVVTVNCSNSGTTTPCQASFYTYTDSSCVTHFVNSTPCTYSVSSWNINGTMYYTSSPALSLTNGNYSVILNTSIIGSGVSTSSNVITVVCNSGTTTPTGCQANAQFYVFADSTNAGNYFAYNNSTGSGTLSYLWNFGDGNSSTQQYPFHQYAVPGQYIICLIVTATSGTTTCSDTYCDSSSVQRMAAGFLMSQFNVVPQSTTGIKQTKILTGLNAYPNPIADELTIETTTKDNSKLNYLLIDALGRVVLRGNIENSKTTINTSALEKGFYSLSITDEKGSSLKAIKLVK